MRALPINRHFAISIVGNIIFVLAIVFIADWGLGTTIENIKTAGLKNEAATSVTDQKTMNQDLTQEIEKVKSDIESKEALKYPTLSELKKNAANYKLTISRIEKSSRSLQDKIKAQKYTIVFLGSMSGLVKFINEIEKGYLFQADQLLLRPADENGETVGLSMSLYISEV